VKFTDPQLQQRVERNAACIIGVPKEQRPICGLLDAYYSFGLLEGDQSPRVAEAVQLLLSPELRPALRAWYHRFGDDMNANAIAVRERLSELAGERFG
jgi:hypothetical protein